MKGRALHADELGGSGDIAAEPGDLRQQIFLFKLLTCLRSADHDVLIDWLGVRGIIMISWEQISGDRTIDVSPRARIIRRSILFFSWRTLPGQLCACSTANASSPILRMQCQLRNLAHEAIDKVGYPRRSESAEPEPASSQPVMGSS